MYYESLERQYNSKHNENAGYYKKHDSLAKIDSFKKVSLAALDTINMKIEEIKALAEYQGGNLPKKLELNLLRIEERGNDLRAKIRNPRNADRDRVRYELEVQKELDRLKVNLNQYKQ
jgi:hypothetical protein